MNWREGFACCARLDPLQRTERRIWSKEPRCTAALRSYDQIVTTQPVKAWCQTRDSGRLSAGALETSEVAHWESEEPEPKPWASLIDTVLLVSNRCILHRLCDSPLHSSFQALLAWQGVERRNRQAADTRKCVDAVGLGTLGPDTRM